jgi:hypothetical protein
VLIVCVQGLQKEAHLHCLFDEQLTLQCALLRRRRAAGRFSKKK